MSSRIIRIGAATIGVALGCAACVPTFQSPRVEPGFRLDADVMVLAGRRVDSYVSGNDYMVTLTPAYGWKVNRVASRRPE